MTDHSGKSPESRSYGLEEVARILTDSGRPTTKRMLQDYCQAGVLKGMLVGTSWQILQADLAAFLNGPRLAPSSSVAAGSPTSTSGGAVPGDPEDDKQDEDPARRARRALDQLKAKLEEERRRRQGQAAPVDEATLDSSACDLDPDRQGRSASSTQDFSLLIGEARSGSTSSAPGRVYDADEGLDALNRPAGPSGDVLAGPGPDELLIAVEDDVELAPAASPEDALEEEEFAGRGLRMICECLVDESGISLRHGVYESWYASGQQAARGDYRMGKLDGAWQQWHENGRVNCVGLHVDGLPQGPWTWWDEDGRKTQEVQYERGRLDGLWAQFHPNGRKWCEGRYQDGEPEGVFRYWDIDGRPS